MTAWGINKLLSKHGFMAIAIFASIVAFFALTWDLRPFPINAGVDDAKYVKDALEIVNGNWLGAYDNLTLSKRPFFGIVQAARIHLGIPYTTFEFSFHIFCMLAFLWALINLGFNKYFSLFSYFLILFMPQFYDFQTSRVSRDLFNTDLQILIFSLSFVLALAFDKIQSTRNKGFLVFSLCLLLSLHYGTREESFLIWPGLLILLIGHVQRYGPTPLFKKWRYGMSLCLFFLSVVTTTNFLWQLKNYSKYGLFITIEHEAGSFSRAIGALASIKEETEPSRLLIDRNERLKLAKLSPTFAKVYSSFDNPDADPSERCQKEGHCEGYDYSHQIFAFRDLLPKMGVGNNAREAELFYRSFAREVEDLCVSGSLKCVLPLRATMLPSFSMAMLPRFSDILAQHIREIFESSTVGYSYWENPFTADDQVKFEKMTLQKVFLLKDNKLILGELPTPIENINNQINRRQRLAALYSIFTKIFITLGVVVIVFGLFFGLFKNVVIGYILAAALVTIILRVLAITSIGAVDSQMANAYLYPIYPVVIWFFLIAVYEVVSSQKFFSKSLKRPNL
ncbi:MAG: hypothetical protein SGJ18_12505 [Pseudomonadota bacterium]|nr:hypothetical protein [Pseudomonadota bacterium]